jgi:hypothetical protein
VTLTLAEAARYRDGRVAEFWVFSQSMYLAAQLGLIEPWWKTD